LNVWELIIQQPLTNVLIVMANFLGDNFGLAIIALTIIINLILLPMTLSQIRSSKAMQDLQPKIAELQKKYSKDRQKLAQEQMKLWKEAGVKPAGCALTMIIQMPIWIALYQSILLALAKAPEGLVNLSRFLYPWDVVYSALPLPQGFLWLNLAQPDQFYILPLFVAATMWVQQKMTSNPDTADPRAASQMQMMQWMMPILFGVISMSVPSGLALYWAINSLFRIILQYRIAGWGSLFKKPEKKEPEVQRRLKFDATEKKPSEQTGADLVIDQEGTVVKPDKSRYQPGKKRSQRRKQ